MNWIRNVKEKATKDNSILIYLDKFLLYLEVYRGPGNFTTYHLMNFYRKNIKY